MNETKREIAYKSCEPVAALNRVPGFDPLRFLRREVLPETGETVWKIDLRYKKMWFRLVHREGRLQLNRLKITDQMAMVEAQVYFDRADSRPVSSFAVMCRREDVPDGRYIEAAQDAALDRALSDAGFGIQFADVSTGRLTERFGSVVPVTAIPIIPEKKHDIAEEEPATVRKKQVTEEEKNLCSAQAEPSAPPVSAPVIEKVEAEIVEEPIRVRREPVILRPAAPAYTMSTPVEKIMEQMTVEEAGNLVIDVGICKGQTISEVAQTRMASLKWYVMGYSGENNILRAAARIMVNEMNRAA